MALVSGSVTVNPDLTHTGTGLALYIYEAQRDFYLEPAASAKSLLDGLALRSATLALAIIEYLTGNTVVTVTIPTNASGLQRTPDPNDPNQNCQGPSVTKQLTGVIS